MARLLPAEFLLCRMLRSHAWESYVPNGSYKPPAWGQTFHLRCPRCGTARHDTIDTLGQLSTRRYQYPEAYHLPADEVPATEQLRLEYVRDMRSELRARRKRNGNNRRRATA